MTLHISVYLFSVDKSKNQTRAEEANRCYQTHSYVSKSPKDILKAHSQVLTPGIGIPWSGMQLEGHMQADLTATLWDELTVTTDVPPQSLPGFLLSVISIKCPTLSLGPSVPFTANTKWYPELRKGFL